MKILIFAGVLLLSACTTTVQPTGLAQLWCEQNQPHAYSIAVIEAMTPEERRRELEYQLLGEKRCGWDL
jgi:hypothetical protein